MVSSNHFRRIDYIKITVFGFALAALWSSLHTIILPLRILGLVMKSCWGLALSILSSVHCC